MRFLIIFTVAAIAFGFVAAQASQAQQIVQTFKQVTTLSISLRTETQNINILNVLFLGYNIAKGLLKIVVEIGKAIIMLSSSTMVKLGDADAQLVVEALKTFVQVHQALLQVIIGKHGLLTLILFSEPIRQALVSLEAAVDTFAFLLIALIPTQGGAADLQFGALKTTIESAISTYS